MTLYQITFSINFLALIAALWLGLYLVTRNPRTSIAWLTALTLWSLGGLFLNILLALDPPPILAYRLSGLRVLFPFWPSGTFEKGANSWLQGWSVAPAVAFWHHATMLMRPGKMNPWRWVRVTFGYMVALSAIEVQAFTQILFSVEGGDPLYLNSLKAGPLYSVFGVALILLTSFCVTHLIRSARVAPTEIIRRQLMTLVTATISTGLIIPVSLVSSGFDIFPMPMAVMSSVLAIFVGMVGYGVARYSALTEKRTIERDFLYNLSGVAAITLIYTAASLLLINAYEAPKVIVIIIPLLGVVTHTGLNAASIFLDWFFYRGETRQLRINLRNLRRLAGESENFQRMLEQILDSLCKPIKATYGIILVNKDGTSSQIAAYHWKQPRLELPSSLVATDDVLYLTPKQFPVPLEDAALLVPLYNESEQVGTLILGSPSNGLQYSNDDVDLILYPADHIADALFHNLQNTEHLEKVAVIANDPPLVSEREYGIPTSLVENVLRNLFDYAYLADTPLSDIKPVREHMSGDKKTHIERGKAVQAFVLEAIEQMRPNHEIPRDPPPREWYPYIILHDAYVKEVQNRDIMSRLYISEGTFNRTRRGAIRSLARALAEMEGLN